jgi:hypothetical protein
LSALLLEYLFGYLLIGSQSGFDLLFQRSPRN